MWRVAIILLNVVLNYFSFVLFLFATAVAGMLLLECCCWNAVAGMLLLLMFDGFAWQMSLKANYMARTKDLRAEQSKSQDLGAEVLTLVGMAEVSSQRALSELYAALRSDRSSAGSELFQHEGLPVPNESASRPVVGLLVLLLFVCTPPLSIIAQVNRVAVLEERLRNGGADMSRAVGRPVVDPNPASQSERVVRSPNFSVIKSSWSSCTWSQIIPCFS